MWHNWILTKKEIEKWIGQKLHEFAAQENRNLCLSKEEWLQRYLYTEEHEVFLCSFPCELYEWLAKLVDGKPTWKLDNDSKVSEASGRIRKQVHEGCQLLDQ